MPVEITIPQSARVQFQSGLERVAQQLQSRFKGLAVVKTGCTGKAQAHRKVQKMEMTDITGRLQNNVGNELSLMHRYVFPKKAGLTTWLDEDDAQELDAGVAPTGSIVTEHGSAAARKTDAYFLNGIIGDNLEGIEDSMSTVAVPVSQKIAVNAQATGSANLGLTLYKLVKAKAKFAKNEVYGQDVQQAGGKLVMAVSQDELDNLLLDVEKTGNADYNKVRALVDGEVDYFMGITFIRTELLPTTSVGATSGAYKIRTCPMWVTTGVHMDFWYDVKTNIDVLPQKSQAIQVYSRIKLGACRHDEDRVVLVYCEQPA